MAAIEEQHKQFQAAAENSFDHIIVTDPNGRIEYANHSAEIATGYELKEIIGNNPSLWGGLMPKAFYDNLWHVIKDLKLPFIGEIRNRRKSGEEYIAELHISPVFDDKGEIAHFVGIERDVTKMRELDATRLEFVTLASHQLRTPLSTLNWYSEVLLSGDIGEQSPEQEMYTKEIYKASQRMVALVNDLLNLSRIDLGKIAVQSTDVNVVEILDQTIGDQKAFILEKNIKVEIDAPSVLEIKSDEQILLNVMSNLVSNAVKYTPPDGRIKIVLGKKGDKLHFSITDTGYGIPKQDQGKLFNKFFRAENVKRHSSDGTGLGLYIVKAFLENAGGKIEFESKEMKGTTFTFELPLVLKGKS